MNHNIQPYMRTWPFVCFRYIGELFKLRVVSENVIHECLTKLLRSSGDDSLEVLCQLLTTTGQELDSKHSKLQKRMDLYFEELETLANELKRVPARIRFMLQDTVYLREMIEAVSVRTVAE